MPRSPSQHHLQQITMSGLVSDNEKQPNNGDIDDSNSQENIVNETEGNDNDANDLEAGGIMNEDATIEELFKSLDSRGKKKSDDASSSGFESAFDFDAKFESKFEAILESKLASNAFESVFAAKFESRFESAFKTAYEKELMKEDEEGKYPRDCYSFVALGPSLKNYCIPFFFGCIVFLFQFSLLALMLFSKTYFFTSKWQALSQNEDIDNPDQSKDTFNGGSFIPANASVMVRMTQFVAVLSFVVIGGDSLHDFTQAVMDFPRSCNRKYVWLQVSCVLRGLQGLLACVTAILLVVTSNDVIDIVLNFAAIHFISSFDDTAYQLAEAGCYGKKLQQRTETIKQKTLPKCIFRWMNPMCSQSLYLIAVTILGVVLMTIVTLVTIFGEHPNFWTTRLMRVEFGEESLYDYSGCFEITDYEHHRRVAYQSFSLRDNMTASLAYCQRTRAWVFHSEDPATDPCDLTNATSELAHSSKTSSFDIITASENTWFSMYDRPIAVNFLENEDNHADKEFFNCGVHVGDGLCNDELNTFMYQYDGGDCCATSCRRPEYCGTGSVLFESAFGVKNVAGYGFPFTCEDPNIFSGTETVPVEIHLDEIVEGGDRTGATQIPYLNLVCMVDNNPVQFFSIPLEKSMEGKTQTIVLKDRLECSLHVEIEGDALETDSDSFDIKYRVFPVLQGHVVTDDDGDIVGKNWNLGVYSGDTDTKKDFTVYSGYSKSSTKLDLSSYQMYGTIPTEIGLLSSLKSITLGEGGVDGSIPSEIGSLTSLTKIDFAINAIDGGIPREIGYLTMLERLNFYNNEMAGSILSEIGYLTSLTEINLRFNDFAGYIPSEIGLLTSLSVLIVDENKMNGNIPTEVGRLTSVISLQFGLNFFEGSIVSEIGLLTSLKHFDLAINFLSGEIPSEIGLMTSLTHLAVDENILWGTIPSEIKLLTSLTTFFAFENELYGPIPTEIGLMTQLTRIDLESNWFSGTIPTEIGLLTNLEQLTLASNYLTGEIPSEIGLLTSLKWFNLHDNYLEGPLPTELGLLTSLLYLTTESNNFTGEIPCELQKILLYLYDSDEFVYQKNGTELEYQDGCPF